MARPYIPPRAGSGDRCTCPHCCELTTLTDLDLYYLTADEQGTLAPHLLQQIDMMPQHFSAGRCAHCKGVVIFAGEELIYPRSSPYDVRYVNLPDHLRADARRAVQYLENDPAICAARLRGLLQKICHHWGMSRGANVTYVSFLHDRLQDNIAMRQILLSHCMRGELCVQPMLIDEECDDVSCANALAELIGEIAEEQFEPAPEDGPEII